MPSDSREIRVRIMNDDMWLAVVEAAGEYGSYAAVAREAIREWLEDHGYLDIK